MKLNGRIRRLEQILNPKKHLEIDLIIDFVTPGNKAPTQSYRLVDGKLVQQEDKDNNVLHISEQDAQL